MSKNSTDQPVRVRQSIVKRLNARLFCRMLGLFVSIDIVLALLAGLGLAAYAEHRADEAVRLVASAGIPDTAAESWLTLSGVHIEAAAQERGIHVPVPFSYFLPESARSANRRVALSDAPGESSWRKLNSLTYSVYPEKDGAVYEVAVSLSTLMAIIKPAAIVLAVWELLVLLFRTGRDRRMVRRELDPITELTRAAQSLNDAAKQLDHEKMAAMAGKLEGINAARLDTRLQVDGTQEELKNLAGAINNMLDRVSDAYRAQVRFVSDASHELRTPISVIQGYANLLDRWGKNDEKTLQESISAIKEEAANMKDLVEQLLFLARGDNNTIFLQTETLNLAELVREVAGETAMIDLSHTFETKVLDVTVSADRALIKQALRILVDNAVKYTDAGGTITLLTSSDGGSATLSVRDNGIGISPEVVPHIFDRFYRADDSRTRATGGAGLGLSIAQWIAARHGGHMEVLSREGIGTKMSIVLPMAGNISLPQVQVEA